MRRASEATILFLGVLIAIGALPHAFAGWPALEVGLDGVDPNYVRALHMGWNFGSLAMAAMGGIVVYSAVRLRRGASEFRWPAFAVGLCYAAFGVLGIARAGLTPHFATFLAVGTLLSVAAVARRD